MNWRLLLNCLPVMLIAALLFAVNHYRDNAITFREQRDKKSALADARQLTIIDMQSRQRMVADIDAKYTKELADAKVTIDQLQSDVAVGRKRLQLNATCKSQSTTGTSSLGDDATPRLNDAAERDYFTLRERISSITGQVNYLQDYIRTIQK